MGFAGALRSLFASQAAVDLDDDRGRGDAEEATRALIAELTGAVALDVRTGSSDDALDCVITSEGDLAASERQLEAALGAPVKPFGQRVNFGADLQQVVDWHGGIQKNQCLYLRKFENGRIAYAALWPWANRKNVTLKVGVYD